MEKTINTRWSGNPGRYTIAQLFTAQPKAFQRIAEKKARRAGRAVLREDCLLFYKEPSGLINTNGVSAALKSLETLKDADINQSDLASARAELQQFEVATGITETSETGLSQLSAFVSEQHKNASRFVQPKQAAVRPASPVHGSQAAINPQQKLIEEFLTRAQGSSLVKNPKLALDPHFRTALFRLADTMDGRELIENGLTLMELRETYTEPAAFGAKAIDFKNGVIDQDFRPLPNYRTLGIDRAAGDATPDELRYALGQTKNDNTPVGPTDFFSVGALLVNIGLIGKYMAFVPPIELGRLGLILETRSKKSDCNHSRDVNSGHFTIVNPKIGKDPGTKLEIDHPLLNQVPYTALIARLIYPIQEFNLRQKAAVEDARRGRLQNLSVAFNFKGVACATCGDMAIKKVLKSGESITGFMLDPEAHPELCKSRNEDERFYRMPATLRVPADTEGGFIYRDLNVLNAEADGNVQIDPIPQEMLSIKAGSVLLTRFHQFFDWWSGGSISYCQLHGLSGTYMHDGRRIVGQVTQVRDFINTAHVDAGAIADARCVLNPDVKY